MMMQSQMKVSEESQREAALLRPKPRTLGQYLDQLEAALGGSDPALLQDALYDAEEHLRSELGEVGRDDDVASAMDAVLESYGTPSEIADAYVDAEARLSPDLPGPNVTARPLRLRFFGALLDPVAYTSLFFNLLGLVTGMLFFIWAVGGLSLTLGVSLLIIGLPFAVGYLASVRVLALVEGRIVEGLVGVRMPRRPVTSEAPPRLLARLRYWLAEPRTWSTWLYLLLRLPVSLVVFTVTLTLLALSVGLVITPFTQLVLNTASLTFGSEEFFWPNSLLWVPPVLGALVFVVLLQLSKVLARGQAILAKQMLVR